MNLRLTQITENFIKNVWEKFSKEKFVELDEMESELWVDAKKFVADSLAAYAEMVDEAICSQKKARRELGIGIHKRNNKREYISKFGPVRFNRSYFKTETGYDYLADKVVGLEAYERVSRNVSAELVDKAAYMSYQKSAVETIDGALTKQTVLNKIRKTKGLELIPSGEKKKVNVLHVVADEDHVPLQNGRNVIVPLITVHEGIEKVGKNRNKCRNAIHFTKYGKETKHLWEEVSAWLREEYDLDCVGRIYLHGDGAKWIKYGLEVLPNSKFVLDSFHLEKALKQVTAGKRKEFMPRLRKFFNIYDLEGICTILDEMLLEVEDMKEVKIIQNFWKYISNNWDGIKIKQYEPQCGGSCTEAQISHVLADRLSRKPLGWSEKGLEYMSLLRVYKENGGIVTKDNILRRNEKRPLSEMEKRVVAQVKEIFDGMKDYSVFEAAKVYNGKVTPISTYLKGINRSGFPF
jgi:hypothetical protein